MKEENTQKVIKEKNKYMKIKFHIPTEQYGFIEVEEEGGALLLEKSVENYNRIKEAYHNPDRKTTCIKCREHIDVKEEASKLFSHKDQK